MKITVEIRHPAHFHHFHYFIDRLKERGHEVKILAVDKDLVISLLDLHQYQYHTIGVNRKGIVQKILELIRQDFRVYRICRNFKPDLMTGRPSQTGTLISRLLRTRSFIFAEDDLKAVLLNGMMAFPFARVVLAPYVTDLGMFNRKKIPYNGYQKLAYLHPNVFVFFCLQRFLSFYFLPCLLQFPKL